MKRFSRRLALKSGLLGGAGLALPALSPPGVAESDEENRELPLETVFRGSDRFRRIVRKALDSEWRSLPINQRMIRFARELHGTPYENFTLEIDDHIESPSVNLLGLDCWTFFEISLGLARMLGRERDSYAESDLLSEIRWTRYRGGMCSGNYLERIHYLAEWFFENEARGTISHLTREFEGAEKVEGRRISEMSVLWKHYRYLRENPDLRGPMKRWEDYVSGLPVHFIPKDKVARIEPELRDGDIIGIVTRHHGGFCSHVGLTIRTRDRVTRFMHASRNYRRVVIDKSVSGYLGSFRSHAGILVGRPLEVDRTVTDPGQYRANLKKLTG